MQQAQHARYLFLYDSVVNMSGSACGFRFVFFLGRNQILEFREE
jgi:hypothetical protein